MLQIVSTPGSIVTEAHKPTMPLDNQQLQMKYDSLNVESEVEINKFKFPDEPKLVETYNLPNCDEVLTQSRQNIRYSIDEDNIFTQSSICSGLVKKQNSKEIKKMTENYAGDISKQSDTKISCFVQFDKQQ